MRPWWLREKWKPIEGWDGKFSVSSLGRVRREGRKIPHARGFRYANPKLLTITEDKDLHLRVDLRLEGKKETHRVRYLVAKHWLNNYSGGKIIHINKRKDDCSKSNLRELNIPKTAKKIKHATKKRKFVILTEEQVKDCLRRLKEGTVNQTELAKEYGVSKMTISYLSRGKKHARVWQQEQDIPRSSNRVEPISPEKQETN